jgi:3-hydroxyisobutyrate dehydrogenase-like beta-hydroxyacid dehydrogenase
MRAHDYTTLFKTAHMLKDLTHCLDASREAGAPFPMAAQTREVFAAAVGRGRGDEDFSSIIEVLEGLAGRRLPSPPYR